MLDGHSAELLLVAAHAGGFARSPDPAVPGRADARRARTRPADRPGRDPAAGPGPTAGRRRPSCSATTSADVPGRARRRRATPPPPSSPPRPWAPPTGALERTVEYVRQREQFGRAIGSFQAVKHRLADVYVQVQAARSAAYYAAWAAGTAASGSAGSRSPRPWRRCGPPPPRAIQLHGGIGFTWEHEAHLYFKRAAGDELLFGPVAPAAGARRRRGAALRRRSGGGGLMAARRAAGAEGVLHPGVRQGRPACHPGPGPGRAPAHARQGAAQRADAARACPHRRAARRSGLPRRTPLACMPEEGRRRAGSWSAPTSAAPATPPGPRTCSPTPTPTISWKGAGHPRDGPAAGGGGAGRGLEGGAGVLAAVRHVSGAGRAGDPALPDHAAVVEAVIGVARGVNAHGVALARSRNAPIPSIAAPEVRVTARAAAGRAPSSRAGQRGLLR